MADDNRVLKAWAELNPEQQAAMLARWGSEKAWYLCKYTNTIATGLRDEIDASELARHYQIPLSAVKLAGEVAKGSVIQPQAASNVAVYEDEEAALPPGAVQGPIIIPTPPPVASVKTTPKSSGKEVDPPELEKKTKPKKRGRKSKKTLAKEAAELAEDKEEKLPEPLKRKEPLGPPPLHPKAQVIGGI